MKTFLLGALIAAAAALSAQALSQGFPNRPITLIYPYPPGGTDALYRALGEEASKTLGQPIVLDYRPGAGARLGVMAMARAQPDGYLVRSSSSPG